ncbi:MAG: LamG-like jellyroll fold domain-containing protein, partial [Planctomycetota bacterium]
LPDSPEPSTCKSFSLLILPQNHPTHAGQLNLHVYGSDGFYSIVGGPAIQPDSWYHVAMTYTAGEMRLYVNGELVETTSTKVDVNGNPISGDVLIQDTATETRLGTNGTSTSYFTGHIDDLRVYDSVISESEVSDLYSAVELLDFVDEFDVLDTTRWNAVVGDWSVANGVLTGVHTVGANNAVGTLLLTDLTGVEHYEFEVELAGDSGGFSLYNSPGNGYTINTNRTVENLGISYYENGQALGLYSVLLADLGLSDVIQTGQPVAIKIARAGDEFTLSINGTDIYTFTDTLWNGDVELGIRAHGSESYERATWSTLDGTSVTGDITGDGYVGVEDLDAILATWGDNAADSPEAAAADLSEDGVVGSADLQIVIANWGNGSPAVQPTSNPDSDQSAEDGTGNSGDGNSSSETATSAGNAVTPTRPSRPQAPGTGVTRLGTSPSGNLQPRPNGINSPSRGTIPATRPPAPSVTPQRPVGTDALSPTRPAASAMSTRGNGAIASSALATKPVDSGSHGPTLAERQAMAAAGLQLDTDALALARPIAVSGSEPKEKGPSNTIARAFKAKDFI